jgi:hypothetical protein
MPRAVLRPVTFQNYWDETNKIKELPFICHTPIFYFQYLHKRAD